MFLSYKGTFYHGWQIQPGAVSVQQTIEERLSTVLGETIHLTGAGRTDTGVHAKNYVAHFDSGHRHLVDDDKFLVRLNKFLPSDIAVNSIIKVRPDAHARFNAISRTYRYYVTRSKDPFQQSLSWYIYGDIDIRAMNQACNIMYEFTDFTSFAKLHSDVKTNNCVIHHASWRQEENKLIFTIKADRFLRNMVRAITGTMVDVGKGRINCDDFRRIMIARNRSMAGKSAPAAGLFLEEIEYPAELFTT